ncbi:GbsR/MarR family transcriptional regulator [Novosphingobium sp. M1R2S20]|uniref:GbsR/MarR family transcriptional regulator n=1 Tax=Novosphingobium rhizovicinum TaxID=3228928 RepID=A0ABV3R9Z6_9SPHN
MPNIDHGALSGEQRRFIDDMAALLIPWGMQPSLAQLYPYLLLKAQPVSLDDIAENLGMAKSSASVAARMLERYGLARRYGEPGSKRVRYGASESYSGFISSQAELMGSLGRMIEVRAPAVAEEDALRRLTYLGSFNRKMEATILDRIRQLTEEFVSCGPDEDQR